MKRKIVSLSALALVLTACGGSDYQPVHVQPIHDKIGNATCPGGYQIAITQAGDTICVPG